VRPATQCGARTAPGFALVSAIFLLVVLALLAVVAIRAGSAQQQTVTAELLQARALAAANSGIEWAAYEALHGANCAASTSLSLTEGALNGFGVTVTCTSASFTNGTGTNHAFLLQSSASSGVYGKPGYVHRVVSATFTDAAN